MLTVQGVVGRVKMEGLSGTQRVQVIFHAQIPSTGMTVILKAAGDQIS